MLLIIGVAIATITSQLISATLSIITLLKSDGYGCLKTKYLKISKEQLKQIMIIGVPSAFQSLAFNISNVMIQSKVNSFGAVGTAANTAAAQFDAVIYNVGNAVAMSGMAFASQNIGAKNMARVKKTIFNTILLVFLFQFGIGALFALLSPWLVGFIVSGSETIQLAASRLTIMGLTYFLCGIMEVFANSVRAMGKPIVSLIVSVFGAAVFRVAWLEVTFLIWPYFHTIFLSYLASWSFTIIIYLFVTPKVFKKVCKQINQPELEK